MIKLCAKRTANKTLRAINRNRTENWFKFFNRNWNPKLRQTETGTRTETRTRTETGTEKSINFHECEGLQILWHPILWVTAHYTPNVKNLHSKHKSHQYLDNLKTCEFPHKLPHKTIVKIKIVTHILVNFRTVLPALTKISNLTGTETKMSVYVQILATT